MWILFRLCCFLIGAFASKFYSRTPKYDQTTSSGTRYQLKEIKQKGQTTGWELLIECPLLPYLRIQRETYFSRFIKALGFAREMQTGDPNIDDTLFIATDNHSLTLFLKTHPEILKTVKVLFDAGWNQITSRHFSRQLRFKGGSVAGMNPQTIPLVNQLIEKFKIFPAHLKRMDPFDFKVFIFETIAFGFVGYALGGLLELVIFDTFQLLNPFSLALKGLAIGFAIFVLWMALAAVVFKRSSRIVPLISDLFLIFLLCSVLAGPQIITDLNKGLDRSASEIVKAHITHKETQKKRSRRGRTTTDYYFHLNFDENQKYAIPGRLQISSWDYNDYQVGQTIEIYVRDGFFNSPYIDDIELSATPLVSSSENLPTLPQAPDVPAAPAVSESLINAARWKAEPPTQQTTINFRQQKYDSKRIRSIEPFVNNQLNGLAHYWHENGQAYAEIPWVNGQKHGRFTTYRKDGSRSSDLSYKDGKAHGLLSWYDKKGQLLERHIYIDGQVQRISKEELDRIINSL